MKWHRYLLGAGASAVLALAGVVACSGSAVVDGPHGSSPSDCAGRVLEVACRAEPPICPTGQFPASDGNCWTGKCLDCIDGCQQDSDCVVVEACGCYYHEGCSWAETSFRAKLLYACYRLPGEKCTADCPQSHCEQLTCPWCSADGAKCENGSCKSVVSHPCY